MEALSKPLKIENWQITKIRDKLGLVKINIRLYYKQKNGLLNYQASQNIYAFPEEWDLLKRHIRGARRRKEE